jgi:hypothetical protein
MDNRRACGHDGFPAELLKYGGATLKAKIFEVVKEMWRRGATAGDAAEGDDWPPEWRLGIVVPLWKRKGCKRDKAMYRGICLLSVGTKLLARIVSSRLQWWSEGFMDETQNGNRRGRGVDDVLQVSRRIAEEICRLDEDEWYLISLFDLEKAFPKVCRDALWRLLEERGCPVTMIRICKGLHENTRFAVRVHGGLSREWLPARGLREGCPSSPVLFKVYHHAVMADFRGRRAELAESAGTVPGIRWQYKVDGRIIKKATLRVEHDDGHPRRDTQETIFGEFGFADDTGLVGVETETRAAEGVLEDTIRDWEGAVNVGKTERLRMNGVPRVPTDVRNQGEAATVRQLGGWLSEDSRQYADTAVRVAAGKGRVRAVSKAWGSEGRFGRGERSKVKRHVRLTIMKAVVMPTVTTFCKTRAWTTRQLDQVQRVANYAVRKALGIDSYNAQEHHLKDLDMYRAVGWDRVVDVVMRQSLAWLGHVARMPISRHPKIALFGWVAGKTPRQHGVGVLQPNWLKEVMQRVGIMAPGRNPQEDWFRRAQNRRGWKRMLASRFPGKRSLANRSRLSIPGARVRRYHNCPPSLRPTIAILTGRPPPTFPRDRLRALSATCFSRLVLRTHSPITIWNTTRFGIRRWPPLHTRSAPIAYDFYHPVVRPCVTTSVRRVLPLKNAPFTVQKGGTPWNTDPPSPPPGLVGGNRRVG